MSDVTVQPTAVVGTATVQTTDGTAGEATEAGKVVYRDSSDRTIKLADSNHTSKTAVVGILLNGGSVSQPVVIAVDGSITFTGSTFVPGAPYFLSTNLGGICPAADLPAPTSSGVYVSFLGIATSATVLKLGIHNGGTLLGV